jgi:hypothetical protein
MVRSVQPLSGGMGCEREATQQRTFASRGWRHTASDDGTARRHRAPSRFILFRAWPAGRRGRAICRRRRPFEPRRPLNSTKVDHPGSAQTLRSASQRAVDLRRRRQNSPLPFFNRERRKQSPPGRLALPLCPNASSTAAVECSLWVDRRTKTVDPTSALPNGGVFGRAKGLRIAM